MTNLDLNAYDLEAEPLRARLLALAAAGRHRLPLVEHARRRSWCQQHHDNLTYRIDGDDFVIVWGDAPLVTLDEGLLRQLRDSATIDVDMCLAPDVPDDASELQG